MATIVSELTSPGLSQVAARGDVFSRHRGPITCVVGIPNSRKALTSGYDGAVALFDLDTGAVELLGYHGHLVNRINVNPEGTRAASSSSDYNVFLWDLATLTLERVLRGHSDDVEDFAFAGNNMGVSVSRDQRILIWDLATGAIVRTIEEHEKDVLAVVAHGDSIYTSGDDMTLRQWELATGRLLRKWGPFEHETDTCAIDPVMGRAILGCDDGVIRVFDTRTGGLVRELPAHSSGIKKVCASPATGDILSAAYDQRIRIWDALTLEPKTELEKVPITWERSLNWAPDGRSILAGTFDGTTLEWNAVTGRLIAQLGAGDALPGNACFNEASAGADVIAVVSDDGYIRTARLTPSRAEWVTLVEPASGRMLMNAVTLDDESGVVMTGAHNHRLHIFDLADGELNNEIEIALGEGPINCIRVARNPGFEGDAFVACYSGAIVRVGRSGEIKGRVAAHDGAVKALRIHPALPIGVSGSADGSLMVWNLDGSGRRYLAGHTAIVDDVDFSPSGNLISSAGRDFILKVHTLHDGALAHAVRIGRRSPKSVCFVDESNVVVGDYWGALIRVDLATSQISRAQIAQNGISSIASSGDYLVATSYDGAIYLVEPFSLKVVNTIRAMTQRLQPPAAHAG
jgi:WD40 repeat protein